MYTPKNKAVRFDDRDIECQIEGYESVYNEVEEFSKGSSTRNVNFVLRMVGPGDTIENSQATRKEEV